MGSNSYSDDFKRDAVAQIDLSPNFHPVKVRVLG